MWQQSDDNTTYMWSGASSFCGGLDLAGYTDWRLPHKNELEGLISGTVAPTIDTSFFPGTESNYYWTSDNDSNSDYYAVDFSDGSTSIRGNTNSYYVRCVRDVPYVTGTDPAYNATGVSASIDNITVSFSQPMSGSFWINNNTGVCEGTFQLSSDNFTNCVTLSNWSGSGQTFFFTPAADLSYKHYRIRVDNATSVYGDSVDYTSPQPGFDVSSQ